MEFDQKPVEFVKNFGSNKKTQFTPSLDATSKAYPEATVSVSEVAQCCHVQGAVLTDLNTHSPLHCLYNQHEENN